ncbi:DUF1232 domain-containing protein [Lutibacter sp. HS1-25]|uniref:YkvA family protein n=1 Tax=Lutibacter sp. HS1-25 TaxID=2485000 RepID=UPI0010124A5E|nr:YkvA family protein [Lutibacter sp. HS1-25]RXP63501.1 DUF1232 domain-containing protein [Lutibacter sp. HS1-25]
MEKKLSKKAEKKFNCYTMNANENDIKKINAAIEEMNKGALKQVWCKVEQLWGFIRDPKGAWCNKAIAIGALLYVISPIDAIPDMIPVFGLIDDASVIEAAVTSLSVVLVKYYKNNSELSYHYLYR